MAVSNNPEGVLPTWTWVIDVPARAEDLARRWHNKYAKEALREAVEKWHGSPRGFAKHWRRDARQRYRHWPRSAKYARDKQRRYGSTLDLYKTGRTKRRMLSQYKVTVSGSAERGNLETRLILTFPFRGGTGRFRQEGTHQSITIERMIVELQRFDEEDPLLLAQWFKDAYMQKVSAHRAGRKRIRVVT